MPLNPHRPPAETSSLAAENARWRGDLRTVARRVTHDLRTPLNHINVASEALRDGRPDGESTREFVRTVSESVAAAAALLDRIGVVLMATATGATAEPVAMGEVIWGTLQRLERRIQESGAVVISPASWPEVTGVAAWLDPIWLNLISNSLQHAGPAPRIELGSDAGEGEVRCWVRDGGPGVKLEKRASLFYPLERLSELNAPRTYGLSLVQRLVELQGGRCGYVADPPPGGTFFFTLPTG